MTSAKSLKKALLCSVMALTLCFTMLLGTTYAWFTDSVTNNVNQIVAGNLDIELKHTTNYLENDDEFEVVESTTKLYDNLDWYTTTNAEKPTAWQPDTIAYEGYVIENKGTLPLKYKFTLNFTNATATATGKTLADILLIDASDENGGLANDENLEGSTTLKNFVLEGTLNAGDSYNFITTIAWVQGSTDNDFNVAGGLKIDLGVTLVATQTNPNAELPIVNQGTLGGDDDINGELDDPTLEGIVINNLTSDIVINASNAYLDFGGVNTEKIVINGNGHKITLDTTYWSRLNLANPAAVLVINDATLTSTQTTGTWNSYDVTFSCNVELNNVKLLKSLAFDNGVSAKLKDVEITESNDYYAIWISAKGSNVEIDGLTVTSGRGIKIDEEYTTAKPTTLSIKNATFNTTKKSAIIVKSSALVTINVGENVDITNVQADSTNVVWVDSASAAYYDSVVVNGATKYQEID